MSLREDTLFGPTDKVATAIARMREFAPPEGYYLAFSGGKDSICIYQLALMSGVKFDAHYCLTGIDHPELVRFIKREYPTVAIDRPTKTMWKLIVEKLMPPTRLVRYCCEHLKERGGAGRLVMTGIRAAESSKRKQRRMVEVCRKDVHKTYLHAIIDWTDADVWEFIRGNGFAYPALYDQGYRRLGCIGCPMNPAAAAADLRAYPRFKALYVRSFERMIKHRSERGLETKWKTGDEVMSWWLMEDKNEEPEDENQCELFGFGELATAAEDGEKEVNYGR
jgi:phosphoadenosine phosphosulfate reductase